LTYKVRYDDRLTVSTAIVIVCCMFGNDGQLLSSKKDPLPR